MTTTSSPVFGSSIKRREDPRLITGKGTYVDDVKLAGMLHMSFVRSPEAHANIKSIDTSAAKALSGVVAVYTGEELADKLGLVPCGWVVPDTVEVPHPPMALGKVRCIGEAVVAVIATDSMIAADAAALVDVEYEVLPVVLNSELAVQSGQPQLHEEAANNKCFEWEVAGGDVAQAASEAEVTISQRFVNQRLIPNSMEGRAVIADYNSGTNQITIWTSSQIPHLVKLLLALVTGHPEHQIRVITPDVGGGFGCKLFLYAEELISFAIAKDLGRAVKWTEQRQENYMATAHGRDHIGDWKITGKRDGTITSIEGDVYANLGAYLSTFAPAVPTLLFGLVLSGPYDIPNIRCKVTGVFTNTTPVDAYRGAGRPEATFVVERLVDMFAQEIGMDPVGVRRKNMIEPFDDGRDVVTGVTYDSGNYQGALDRALEMIGYQTFRQEQEKARQQGRYLGIGLSSFIEISGLAPSAVAYAIGARAGTWESATVRVYHTGKVTVFTGSSSSGQGHQTAFAQIAADRLGIPVEDVDVIQGDTDKVQQGTGTFGSRSAAVGGSAVHMSVEKIMDKAKKIAAHMLEASPDDIVFEDGKLFVAGAPAEAKTFQEVALAAYWFDGFPDGLEPGLEATSIFDAKNFTWPFGTHVCIVEVDGDTGETKILRYVAVDDYGNVINPMIVDGMVHGGVAQGIGQALFEEAIYTDDGQLVTGSMLDYAIPKAGDLPLFETDRTTTPSPANPLGVKGAGEAGTIAASPAVINAVVDALAPFGVKHVDMPAKPEKLWKLMQGT